MQLITGMHVEIRRIAIEIGDISTSDTVDGMIYTYLQEQLKNPLVITSIDLPTYIPYDDDYDGDDDDDGMIQPTYAERRTLLEYVCGHGYIRSAELLIDSGAAVNNPQSKYTSALLRACELGHYGCAKLLIDRGADVNQVFVFRNNTTPLICMIYVFDNEHTMKCMKLLIDNGADISRPTHGQSIFARACCLANLGLAKLLIRVGYVYDLTEIKQCRDIGSILYEIDCYEAEVLADELTKRTVKAAIEY